MKKLTLSVAALTIAMMSYGQTQCSGTTTKGVQCKMDVGKEAGLCKHHDPNYVRVEDDGTTTVVCSGTTKAGNKCKSKTKNTNGLCQHHQPIKN
jgi:hypothetical protein